MDSPANLTARTENLIVTEAGGDTLVYDLLTHRAHSLDAPAAEIWRLCDGTRDMEALAASLRVTVGDAATRRDVAHYTVARLRAAGLLREAQAVVEHPVSRRALLRRAAAAGVAAFAVPTVLSVVAPTTLQAQASCLAGGAACVPAGTPCCAPFQCIPVPGPPLEPPGPPEEPGPPTADRFCQ